MPRQEELLGQFFKGNVDAVFNTQIVKRQITYPTPDEQICHQQLRYQKPYRHNDVLIDYFYIEDTQNTEKTAPVFSRNELHRLRLEQDRIRFYRVRGEKGTQINYYPELSTYNPIRFPLTFESLNLENSNHTYNVWFLHGVSIDSPLLSFKYDQNGSLLMFSYLNKTMIPIRLPESDTAFLSETGETLTSAKDLPTDTLLGSEFHIIYGNYRLANKSDKAHIIKVHSGYEHRSRHNGITIHSRFDQDEKTRAKPIHLLVNIWNKDEATMMSIAIPISIDLKAIQCALKTNTNWLYTFPWNHFEIAFYHEAFY